MQALEHGVATYFAAHASRTRAAIRLTLLTAAIVVPLNLLFGIAAAGDRQIRIPRQEHANHAD